MLNPKEALFIFFPSTSRKEIDQHTYFARSQAPLSSRNFSSSRKRKHFESLAMYNVRKNSSEKEYFCLPKWFPCLKLLSKNSLSKQNFLPVNLFFIVITRTPCSYDYLRNKFLSMYYIFFSLIFFWSHLF